MDAIEILGFHPLSMEKIPLFTMSVSAGIPVPVESDIEREVDLNEFLVEHPSATFFAKVHGYSFEEAGIMDGDILIVDTNIEPSDGRFVVVLINNELTVKIFRVVDGRTYLQSHDKKFVPQDIEPFISFNVMGVVTKVIHSL
jgi:DNA polymerase V